MSEAAGQALDNVPVNLVDLLDRVLATGVVVYADLTLTLAGVDLVHVSLQAVLASAYPSQEPS